ncbi:hypothetical protein G9C85_06470 [Halorubellus sp. JP-L1]|uniref:HalOD1 output domain-containing protein n=1 Tax=Halorubellus sp. JP-L1 TaxID=2715753 RepID=UPI00140DC38F|nr:HalOD1 output domain-containing protein [Halorubellus sp. JP-L1]NHN41281.1 hypothetical protein [Halorubellus sp. JP-L1]
MGAYQRRSTETPTEAAYHAVSEVTDRDVLDIPPIGRAIEPDSLDAFVEESRTLRAYAITFEYADCDVTVRDDRVRVERLDDGN